MPSTNEDGARPRERIQSGPSRAAKGGAPPPPTIMAIATALPGLLTATAAPEMTWLPLNDNVAVVDNDRGASPNSYRARALGARAGAQQVPPVTPWMYTRFRVQSLTLNLVGNRCLGCAIERQRARWKMQNVRRRERRWKIAKSIDNT
eukprot:scaffold42066_cov67-Phaeocystis_antarctica.AAC.1